MGYDRDIMEIQCDINVHKLIVFVALEAPLPVDIAIADPSCWSCTPTWHTELLGITLY